MVVIVFRSRVRPGADLAEVERVGQRMVALGSAMPGFVSYREYAAADGESVTLVEFESHAQLAAWRDHPEHLDAQRAGRERFYSTYEMQICNVERAYGFALDREPQRVELIG